jgi:hypothetical protein
MCYSRPCRIADKLKQLRIADKGLGVGWQLIAVKIRYFLLTIFVVWDMATRALIDDCRYQISRRICWLHVKTTRVSRTENWWYWYEEWVKALEMRLARFGRWSRKILKWANLDSARWLLPSPTGCGHSCQALRSIFASLQRLSIRRVNFRESSHAVLPLTPLSKAVEPSHTLNGDTSSRLTRYS